MNIDDIDHRSRMGKFEFACYSIVLACLMFFADQYFSSKLNTEVKQIPAVRSVPAHVKEVPAIKPSVTNPLTRAEKAVLCTGWDQCMLLAELVVYEARGEPLTGKRMVAKVVLNRVEHTSWPDTLEDVIHEPHQFSYLKDMHRQRTPTKEDWVEGQAIAYNILHGIVDVDTDAVFYHEKSVKPFWAKSRDVVAEVGNHIFYNGSK